jgi:DNA-binding transcriptional LysR family regulator
MNLEYLKTYLELIKLGSFSTVAKKLGISQPAVSFQIQKLEHDLGARLINRGQKNITMTEAGKRLLEFAGNVTDETGRLFNDLDALRQEVTGELVVVASTIPSEFLLIPILSRFLKLHPAVRARIETRNSLTVIDGVQNGSYDVGFCGIAPPPGNHLDSFKIAEDEIVPIVFPSHPLASKKQVSFADLVGEPFIFRDATSGTQKSMESLFSAAGFNTQQLIPRLVLGNTHSIVSAVEAGAGIAFVSNLAIKRSLDLGLICQLKLLKPKLRRYFYCIHRKESALSRLLGEFLAFIKTAVVSA